MIKYPAQHFFLQSLVDYAGTFPPAGLPLAESLGYFRSYQHGLAPSMLGRFICAGSALAELASLIEPGDRLVISVLLSQPEEVSWVEDFHAKVPSSVRVDTVETAWSPSDWLQRWNYRLFFEVTSRDFAEAAAFCAPHHGRLGLKLRTGSVKPEGIPPAQQLVDFLDTVHSRKVPYKFTAGLHHASAGAYPLSYAEDAPRARLFGFVSLFTLACLHWCGRLNGDQLLQALQQDGPLITADAQGLGYASHMCSNQEVAEYRQHGGRSFGSCSFDEPLDELKEMGWIC